MDEESYQKYMDYLKYKKYPLSTKDDDKAKEKSKRNNWRKKCRNKFIKDEALWCRHKHYKELSVLRASEKVVTIARIHSPKPGVCRSMNTTREMISKQYFWKGIQRDVMQYVAEVCPRCSARRTTSSSAAAGDDKAAAADGFGQAVAVMPDSCAAAVTVVNIPVSTDSHDAARVGVAIACCNGVHETGVKFAQEKEGSTLAPVSEAAHYTGTRPIPAPAVHADGQNYRKLR